MRKKFSNKGKNGGAGVSENQGQDNIFRKRHTKKFKSLKARFLNWQFLVRENLNKENVAHNTCLQEAATGKLAELDSFSFK